jgi:hypothetical protein
MGLGRIDKLIHSHGLAWNHTKWLELNSGPFGVGTAMGELELTLTHHTPGLGVSHHLTPYSILCDSSRGWHPNGLFVPGVPKLRNFGLPRLWSLITFGADLWSSCRLKQNCRSRRDLFQRYVSRSLKPSISGRFPTFIGRESKLADLREFDSRAFFWP